MGHWDGGRFTASSERDCLLTTPLDTSLGQAVFPFPGRRIMKRIAYGWGWGGTPASSTTTQKAELLNRACLLVQYVEVKRVQLHGPGRGEPHLRLRHDASWEMLGNENCSGISMSTAEAGTLTLVPRAYGASVKSTHCSYINVKLRL